MKNINIIKILVSLKNNITNVWPFYNVTSIRNSNVSTISIIQRNLTSSKSETIRKNKSNYEIKQVIELRLNNKRKWNLAETLFYDAMQTYHKKLIQKWGPKVIVSLFRTYLERTSKRLIFNVIKNTGFRNLEKCSCKIIQSTSLWQTKK